MMPYNNGLSPGWSLYTDGEHGSIRASFNRDGIERLRRMLAIVAGILDEPAPAKPKPTIAMADIAD
jgi:hypothetical protein